MEPSSIARKRLGALLPFLILAAATALYAIPLFQNLSNWGTHDWDQFTFWHAVPRETMLRYFQFPLWNPYSNGGNVMLAMPHSSFLSPQYLLVLLAGPVAGLKLQWAGAVLLGMLGMHTLSAHLGMGRISRFLPPLVFMLSSLYSLHLREGHVEWTVLGLVPWTYLFVLKSRTDPRYFALSVLTLALMIYSGGVYVFSATAAFLAFHALALALREKKAAPLLAVTGMLALTALVGSAKLVPMLELLKESPRPTKDEGRLEAVILPKLFLLRDQNSLYEDRAGIPRKLGTNWDREGWHEFGVYVGLIPLCLAFAGLYAHHRRQKPLLWAGLACLWISMGKTAWFVSVWALLHRLPVYGSLQVPSRFLMYVLFCVAVFAGLGCSDLEQKAKQPYQRRLLAGLILAVFFDLLAVSRPIVANAFTAPPLAVERAPEFRQGAVGYDSLLKKSNSAMYPALLANRGTIDSYDIVGVKRGAVKNATDPGYRGEAYLAGSGARARVSHFSPNKIVVAVEAAAPDVLVLNQNHHPGWRVESGGTATRALAHDGLISAAVETGARAYTFTFRPRSFVYGLLLSAVGLLSLLPFLLRR